MNLFNVYLEMAVSLSRHKNRIYFHGVPDRKKENILKKLITKGLIPNIEIDSKSRPFIDQGKVYLTTEISTAIFYASYKTDTDYGFICVIDGNDLKEIYPDEDGVIELVAKVYYPDLFLALKKKRLKPEMKKFLKSLLNKYNLPETLPEPKRKQDINDPDMYYIIKSSSIGKKLIERANDKEHIELIDMVKKLSAGNNGIFVNHNIIPMEIWKYNFDEFEEELAGKFISFNKFKEKAKLVWTRS